MLFAMDKLRAKLIAYPNADLQLFSRAKKSLLNLFHQERVEFVDKNPDILVFLTGGSERQAIQSVQTGSFYLILAAPNDNAWAAATEVKSWMNDKAIPSMLIDQTNSRAQIMVEALYRVKNGVKSLKGKRFGLIGEPSDWLVNSVIDPKIIMSKLGVEQVNIPWSELNVMDQTTIAPDFLSFFSDASKNSLEPAGKVYETIAKQIAHKQLNAVSVECFSLVGACNTTACLALSKLSMDGIPAGCEGDICSMVGMMLCKEICGIVPWMANVAHVKENIVFLAHCTIPGNLSSSFKIDTHFETGKGLAINAAIRGDEFTLFRVDNQLNRMFVGLGKMVEQPYSNSSCRTQLTLQLNNGEERYFVDNPLGNHHLVIPGNFTHTLALAAEVLGIKRI